MFLNFLAAAGWALVLCLGLHLTLGRRVRYWLAACSLSSFAYVILSLQLERIETDLWLDGLRWGLLATALFAFVRYWLSRRKS